MTLVAKAIAGGRLTWKKRSLGTLAFIAGEQGQQQQKGQPGGCSNSSSQAGPTAAAEGTTRPGRAADLEERRGEGEALVDLVAREHAREAGGRERDVELAREKVSGWPRRCKLAHAFRWGYS
jgi:hypothetical protein